MRLLCILSTKEADYADWKYAVDNEDTVLGFLDWLKHKAEAETSYPAGVGAYANDNELDN
jgi:hypothetical protein